MSKIEDDRPAFPIPLNPGEGYSQHGPADGLTVREYFAAKAMQGLLANPGGPIQANGCSGWGIVNCTEDQIAEQCLVLADALIRASTQENSHDQ
ncbi:hypothetical protein [Bordetella hinzii]|uniref:hypothetical protein n=1 Tax=Bordetella hinzii TaxID=103855 RepID=UPI0005190C7C|nr:hypothetical protein [Bordetella hinzii]